MIKSQSKIAFILSLFLLISACNNKPKPVIEEKDTIAKIVVDSIPTKTESIEGLYETQPDPNNTGECKMSVEIKKAKNGYTYFLITKLRKLRGKASFTTDKSGEKYIVLEGIKWDDFEGDISNEEENDSIADSKTAAAEPETPVGIDASYVKNTLTIQNYGNSMNSYTKISECDRKYIQLIKK